MPRIKIENKGSPTSVRIAEREKAVYQQIAEERDISMSDLIREALREKYFPAGYEDELWYGHA